MTNIVGNIITFLEKIKEIEFIEDKIIPEEFDAMCEDKTTKSLWEKAIRIFNNEESSGIKFFIDNKLVDNVAHAIAQVLYSDNRLSRESIGNFISNNTDISKAVLHELISIYELKDQDLLECLRKFIGNFKMPGESQKIDRIVVEFASCYYFNNKTSRLLSSQDIVYTITYSILLLNSDLHNPEGLKKFSKESYVELTKQSLNRPDFPNWYLEKLFESIKNDEIIIDPYFTRHFSFTHAKKSMEIYNVDLKTIGEQAALSMDYLDLSKSQLSQYSETQLKTLIFYIGSDFCNFFKTNFHEATRKSLMDTFILGYFYIFDISCKFELFGLKEDCLKSLLSISDIFFIGTLEEMTVNSISAFVNFLSWSFYYKNNVKGLWNIIIDSYSKFEYLESKFCNYNKDYNAASAKASTFSYNMPANISADDISAVKDKLFPTENQHEREKNFMKTAFFISKTLISRVYETSHSFDDSSLLDFMCGLTAIFATELEKKNHHPILLHQIIDIFIQNLHREPEVVDNMWDIIVSHLKIACLNDNEFISTLALDGTRQILLKVVEMDTLFMANFQSTIFKFIYDVLSDQKITISMYEYILNSIFNLILSSSYNIKSGWTSILTIFALFFSITNDDLQQIRAKSFENFRTLMLNDYFKVSTNEFFIKNTSLITQGLVNYLYLEDNSSSAQSIMELTTFILNQFRSKSSDSLIESINTEEIWQMVFMPFLYLMCMSAFHSELNISFYMIDCFFELINTFNFLGKNHPTDIFNLIVYIINPPKSAKFSKYVMDKQEYLLDHFYQKITAHWTTISYILGDQCQELLRIFSKKSFSKDLETLNLIIKIFANALERSSSSSECKLIFDLLIDIHKESVLIEDSNLNAKYKEFGYKGRCFVSKSILKLLFDDNFTSKITKDSINFYTNLKPLSQKENLIPNIAAPASKTTQKHLDEIFEYFNNDFNFDSLSQSQGSEMHEFITNFRICYFILLFKIKSNQAEEDKTSNAKKIISFTNGKLEVLKELINIDSHLCLNRKFLKTYLMALYTLKSFSEEKSFLIDARILYKHLCNICSTSKAKVLAVACSDFLLMFEGFIF
ncbi:MAG: Brefeldin A-inhibited guanine nucleotide-exchange protein 1 [Paramarteilia canceri]